MLKYLALMPSMKMGPTSTRVPRGYDDLKIALPQSKRVSTSVVSSRNCNRNLKISKALLKSQAHQGTSLFMSAATIESRGIFQRVDKRSSGPSRSCNSLDI